MGKSQTKSHTHISNISRKKLKSFDQISNLNFQKIPNLSNHQSNPKADTQMNMYKRFSVKSRYNNI